MVEIRWRTASWSLIVKWPGYVISLLQALRHRLFYRGRAQKAAISGHGFDIATVVYEKELFFLRLQARSLDHWLDHSFDGKIIIIVNDLIPSRSIAKIRRWILPEYGRWRDRVHILPFYKFGGGLDPYNGYIFQQPLKLAVSAIVDQPFYLVLDAKNHAVGPVSTRRYIHADGRGLRVTHPGISMRPHHEGCARYFGYDPEEFADTLFNGITPFLFRTQSVRDMIVSIEGTEGKSIFAFFLSTRMMSEFLLYSFYLRARGEVDRFHVAGKSGAAVLWPDDEAGPETGLAKADANPDLTFFAVHLNVWNRLTACERAQIESFWRRHGLLADNERLADLEGDLAGRVALARAVPAPASLYRVGGVES